MSLFSRKKVYGDEDVLQQLRHMFDRKGIASGLEIIKSEMEFDDKIKDLFRGPFQEQPTVLYFDDFEQNLERHGDVYHVTEDVISSPYKLFLLNGYIKLNR